MTNKKSGFLSDYRASEDGLNFGIFKPALRNILESAETPLTVGVFGTWGSGKTSLLNMLKDELDEKKLPSLKTVWFTAWKYEQHEALWRAFMLRVVDGLHPRKEDGSRYQPDDFNTPAEKSKREALLHLGRLERSIYETVNWQDEGQWSLNTGELVKQGSKLPIWLAFHLAGLGGAAESLGLNPDVAKLLEREVREHHLNQLSYMEQFAAEFQKAVQMILGKDGRLVVFVDDLDRCLPEKAVEVLEAIKLFLDVPGTVFVLGMDREVIRRGIETHYGAMLKTDGDDEIPINGDVYLQKIIQIPFNLPPLDIKGRGEFIQMLEKSLPSDYHLDEITRQVFGRGLYPNPRQVKRALNVFYLLKQVALEQKRQGLIPAGVLAFPLLAKTVLIQSQWPELYKLWRQYPTLIQTLEDEYTRQPVSEDEILRGHSLEEIPQDVAPGVAKSVRQTAVRPAARPVATGLMAPFLNERQKYSLLAEILRYPEQAGEGSRRARFGGLKRAEVQIYVGLVGALEQTAAESAETPLPLSEDRLRDLESGDPAKIREIIAALNELEPDPNGSRHASLRKHLVTIAQNPDLPPPARANAADAADGLGFVPDDLYAFAQVKQNAISFYFARYPVTNLQYQRFLESPDFANKAFWGEAGWKFLQDTPTKSNSKVLLPENWENSRFGFARKIAPVVGVSWYEASAYCRWLSTQKALPEIEFLRSEFNLQNSALTFRLPSEKEWVAAAGGEQDKRFAFGELQNLGSQITRLANTRDSGIGRTTPVWMYPEGASQPHKIMDMSGNVFEWQANKFSEKEPNHAWRGGSWDNLRDGARVSYRRNNSLNNRAINIGFRLVALPS